MSTTNKSPHVLVVNHLLTSERGRHDRRTQGLTELEALLKEDGVHVTYEPSLPASLRGIDAAVLHPSFADITAPRPQDYFSQALCVWWSGAKAGFSDAQPLDHHIYRTPAKELIYVGSSATPLADFLRESLRQ
jgi:hypothetical protein